MKIKRDYTPVAHARTTDPETSHEAAASVEHLRVKQQEVLRCLQNMDGYGSDDEIAMFYNRGDYVEQSPSGLRTRRKELQRAKLVRDSGKRTYNVRNRRVIVWELVGNPDILDIATDG